MPVYRVCPGVGFLIETVGALFLTFTIMLVLLVAPWLSVTVAVILLSRGAERELYLGSPPPLRHLCSNSSRQCSNYYRLRNRPGTPRRSLC